MKHYYKIARIAGLHYDAPMDALYKNNPELKSQSYTGQQKALFQMGYVYSDSFSKVMNTLGHDAHEIVYDLEILQKTWAKEKGIKYDPDCWQHDIILAQIKDIKPDIVYFQDIDSLPYSIRKDLKASFPFLKLTVIYRGYPGLSPNTLRELSVADILLVGSPILVEKCKKSGLSPHLVYHSFNEAVLEKIGATGPAKHPKYDFTFVGSSGYGYGMGHQARYWSLVELMRRMNLEGWIHDRIVKKNGSKILSKAYVKGQIRKSIKKCIKYCGAGALNKILILSFVPNKVKRVILEVIEQKGQTSGQNPCCAAKDKRKLLVKPLCDIFLDRCYDPVFGIEMYRVLHQSKVTFNKHSDPAEDTVDNMRLFEATGVGTCLLTDTGKNMRDLFDENHEVVTYSCIEECVEKLNYLLEHDDIRRQIAAAGQKRTLKDHTATNRCRQIDEILQKML